MSAAHAWLALVNSMFLTGRARKPIGQQRFFPQHLEKPVPPYLYLSTGQFRSQHMEQLPAPKLRLFRPNQLLYQAFVRLTPPPLPFPALLVIILSAHTQFPTQPPHCNRASHPIPLSFAFRQALLRSFFGGDLNGKKSKGKQNFLCKDCGRQFIGDHERTYKKNGFMG
jgi:hypothetical protein